MPNNSDNEVVERRFRDMMGLVKFCLESTKREDATGQSENLEVMDADRRAWLQHAIESMTVDTTKQLLESLAAVKETLVQMEKDPNQSVDVQKTCDAIGILTDLCEEIDYAADFVKLDGYSIFKPLISCPHEEMIVKACELIAALAQNNPLCQSMSVQTRLLEQLLDFVDIKEDQSHVKARSYALYAISSIVRSNQEVRSHFESPLDGLSVLLNLLNHQPLDTMIGKPDSVRDDGKKGPPYWWRKLRIRSVFLLRSLCDESGKAASFFYDKQAIIQMASQLKNSHDPEILEHLLHATKTFLMSLDASKQIQSIKLVPDLRSTIEKILHLCAQGEAFSNDYDLTDTRSTSKELLDLIDSFQK